MAHSIGLLKAISSRSTIIKGTATVQYLVRCGWLAYCRSRRSGGGDIVEICYMIETPKTILYVQKELRYNTNYSKSDYKKLITST